MDEDYEQYFVENPSNEADDYEQYFVGETPRALSTENYLDLDPYLQQQQQQKPGWGGLSNELGEMVSNVPGDIYNMVSGLLPAAGKGLSQLITEKHGIGPLRAIGSALGGVAEGGKQLLNAPNNLQLAMMNYGIIPENEIARRMLQERIIPDTGLKKLIFGEEQSGDPFWEGIGQAALLRKPFGAAPFTTGAAMTAAGGGNPLAGGLVGKGIETASNKAIKGYENYKHTNALKNELGELQEQVPAKQQAIELGDLQIEEALKEAGLSESKIAEYKAHLEKTESALKKKLGSGLTHNERVAEKLYEPQKAIQDSISNEYEAIRGELEGVDVPVRKTDALTQLEKDLRKMAPNATTEELNSLLNKTADQLGISIKDKTVPAEIYLNQWRSLRDEGYKLKRQAKTERDAVQRDRLFKQGDKVLDAAEQMKLQMKEFFPGETYGRLLANNERFVKEVIPVRQNKNYKPIFENRKIPAKDLIERFGGQGKGQEQLRQHLLNDPEAAELMLGSRMAEKPELLHQLKEAEQPYFEKVSSETKELTAKHKEILENTKKEIEALNEKLAKTKALEKNKKMNLKEKIEHEKKIEAIKKEIESKKSNIWKKLKPYGVAGGALKILGGLF